MRGLRRLAGRAALVAVLLAGALGSPLAAARPEPADETAALGEAHRRWLEDHELLLTAEERAAFLALRESYQRDAFITRFWRERDPYPDTARNEAEDEWQERLASAREWFGSLQDVRSEMLLLNGPPQLRWVPECPGGRVPLEVWLYGLPNRAREEMYLVFVRAFDIGNFRLWEPGPGAGGGPSVPSGCLAQGGGEEILRSAVAAILKLGWVSYPLLVHRLEAPLPAPSGEWIEALESYSTDLPEGAATFPARLELAYPGRRQTRTVVEATVAVALAELALAELGGARSYNVSITGEVVREDELHDRFRYKFDFPAVLASGEQQLPLVFQRPLRPGVYRLLLLVEDVNGKRFFRVDRELRVPALGDALPPAPSDPEADRLLAEAVRLVAAGETTVQLIPPVGRELLTGRVRFDALVTGGAVAEIAFSLDDRLVLIKRGPPWSIELDLGSLPRARVLRATARDASGVPLAVHDLVLNPGAERFAVRITQPVPGQPLGRSLRFAAEVDVPEEKVLDRLEVHLGDDRVATLFQPPFEQPIALPPGIEVSYLRAVAYTADGDASEDSVFLDAPPGMEEMDVQLVELYVSVVDRQGRLVTDLDREAFRVLEDGAAQQPVRFERVGNLPIKAALLLDVSASMEDSLEEATRAALAFFEGILTAKDRAALVTFNDRPHMAAKLTGDLSVLGSALAGLKAERATSLHDTVVFGLYYLNGVQGQRALVVLSDGQDVSSRFSFPETLDFARHAGIAVYTIGLSLDREEDEARKALKRLAEETGGRFFAVDTASELVPIYEAIEEELRSQYLVVYQSTNAGSSRKFRRVEVRMRERGLEARTMRGYYP